MTITIHQCFLTLALSAVSTLVIAKEAPAPESAAATSTAVCTGYGPQAPRDIDSKTGTNKNIFSVAPKYTNMNLCNIHMHNSAEHKAQAFSIYAGEGEHGHGGGYQCGISKKLSKKELKAPKENICDGLKPGDTIEVHWVHSSCDVKPGEGLGSCMSEACTNPDLRVEAQVFTLVNDPSALNFENYSLDANRVNGYYQAKALPVNNEALVEFLGSTTGPKYNDQQCSPLQVTWSVRQSCSKLDINSLGKWCKNNAFKESHAHGVRKLVTAPEMLSEIK